jgi:LysR family transcriptional regulator, hca operon transcriptional activator
LTPWSVVNRPLEGEAPTIEIALGYNKSNTSSILKLFLSRLDQLTRASTRTDAESFLRARWINSLLFSG